MTEWIYENQNITEIDTDQYKAFVYIITNNETGKKYIGKKALTFKRSKKVSGRKNKKHYENESDWKDYFGSNKEILEDIKENGSDKYTREIIYLCRTRAISSYYEAKLQFEYDVLLHPDKFYNQNIICRMHRKHVIHP